MTMAREAFGQDNLPTPIEQEIGKVAASIAQIAEDMSKAKDEDTQRWNELNAERVAQSAILETLKADKDKADRDAISKAALEDAAEVARWAATLREPSKASLIVGGGSPFSPAPGYVKGSFIHNLMRMKDTDLFDAERREAAEALARMTSFEGVNPDSKGALGSDIPGMAEGLRTAAEAAGGYVIPQTAIDAAAREVAHAKATLGLTAATGGFIMPNASVGDLVKPGRYRSAVTGLVNARRVSNQLSQIPVRTTSPTRAAVVAWGEQKTTANLAYGGYTATMYTLAIIYDLAKQFVKFSQGAAEQDVLEELAHAFELGEAYYILQGSGTSEPYGIQTAIATAFSAYTTAFTASATTLAGSIAKAIATASGDLATRNRTPEAALLGPAAFWTMVSQGTDTAGFFFAPSGGPEGIRPGTLMTPWGIPVYSENQLAGSDDLLVGEFSAVQVFLGDAYRVDTSDQAYDRWDKNLIGFRGEEEMALDARAAVYAGAFQFVADVIP